MPKIELYYWSPVSDKFGHVALKISELEDRINFPNGEIYMSFWPNRRKKWSDFFGVKGRMCTEDFDRKKMKKCGLILRSSIPTKESLTNLSIKSNAAYVRSNAKLFYVNKAYKECIEIVIEEAVLAEFDEKMRPTHELKILSENQLAEVTLITGHFQTKGDPTILDLTPLNLNIESIIQECYSVRNSLGNSCWWIPADLFPNLLKSRPIENCSSMAMRLLSSGGIERYMPLYARFGSTKHFFLLSSTSVFISTSMVTAGLYAVVDNFENETSIFLGAIATLILNAGAILLLENWLEEKKLVGMGWQEGIIGVFASIGFSLPFIFERLLIAKAIVDYPSCAKFSIDFVALVATFFSASFFGYIANLLLYFFGKTGHINTPTNVYNELALITRLREIFPKKVQQALFKKHISFIFVILFGYIICDITRKAGLSHIDSLLVGITVGLIVGYTALKCFFVRHWDKIIDNAYHPNMVEMVGFINKHNRSIGQYTFINMTTLLGMSGMVMFLNSQTKLAAPFKLIFSFLGAMLGYFAGIMPFKLYEKVRKYIARDVADRHVEIPSENTENDRPENSETSYQTSWLFVILIGLITGTALFLVQSDECSEYPVFQWLSGLEGILSGSIAAYALDSKIHVSRYSKSLFRATTSSQEPIQQSFSPSV